MRIGWDTGGGMKSQNSNSIFNVLHLSATDSSRGGASRAAVRVHHAMRLQEGVVSQMLVREKTSSDPSVIAIDSLPFGSRFVSEALDLGNRVGSRLLPKSRFGVPQSSAMFDTGAVDQIEEINPDCVLLHWLGGRTISVKQIGALMRSRRPIAWRLADTWAFSGAEHYPMGVQDRRFSEGYSSVNRLPGEHRWDLNRSVWERKKLHWNGHMHLIAPSNWMAAQVSESSLMAEWPVSVVPTPIDTGWWRQLNRFEARENLGLDQEGAVIAFGAPGGTVNPRKGFDLLLEALARLPSQLNSVDPRRVTLITFGGRTEIRAPAGLQVVNFGALGDEKLREVYTAADLMVVPSRQDNLPQTAMEAVCSGTPVVGFRIGGLEDIVADGVTGRLVEPFSTDALAEAMAWVLELAKEGGFLRDECLQFARKWDVNKVGKELIVALRQAARDKLGHP